MPFTPRSLARPRRVGAMLLVVLALAALTAPRALACDTCGCGIVPPDERTLQSGWTFSVLQQFTEFNQLRQDSQPVPNDNEHELSSITNLNVGYNFNDRLGVNLSLPYIYRSFNRVVGDERVRQIGSVSGLGDATLSAHYLAARMVRLNDTLLFSVAGGLKLPTGSTGYLKEQANALQGGPDSVVGGHDLTLGSGSLDEQVGGTLYARWKRFMISANLNYLLRNTGDHGYRYADEFQWDVAPGYYLRYRPGTANVLLQLGINGQIKGQDTYLGSIPVTDTGLNEVYLGPRLAAAWRNVSASLGVDIPVHQTNTDLQLVPSYRIRGNVVFRF